MQTLKLMLQSIWLSMFTSQKCLNKCLDVQLDVLNNILEDIWTSKLTWLKTPKNARTKAKVLLEICHINNQRCHVTLFWPHINKICIDEKFSKLVVCAYMVLNFQPHRTLRELHWPLFFGMSSPAHADVCMSFWMSNLCPKQHNLLGHSCWHNRTSTMVLRCPNWVILRSAIFF